MDLSESFVDPNRMELAVDESLQHHMTSAATIMSDERDFLRPWRRRVRDLLSECNAEMLEFLEKSGDDGLDSITRHEEFVKTLGSGTLPSGAGWYNSHIHDVIQNDTVLSEINSELGFNLDDARTQIHKVMEMYLTCIKRLFELDGQIHETLDKIEALKKRVEGVFELDETGPEISVLQTSILEYIRSRYRSMGLESDYTEFCKQYARFSALRTVVLALKVAEDVTGGPTCTICTSEKITTALVPCGHSFCTNCASKQRGQCYICRTSVRDKLRVFFV